MEKKKRRAPRRHAFRFKLADPVTGDTQTVTAWAKVIYGKKPVDLILTADDVLRSIKLKGVGNTQTCSMAICTHRLAHLFSHPVGKVIDWTYGRAYVASKHSAKTGLPVECYAYSHDDQIAQLNDTKGGQQKLLGILRAKGDRTIQLKPIKLEPYRPGRPRGKNTGERSTKRPLSVLGMGAKRRFAAMQLGGIG